MLSATNLLFDELFNHIFVSWLSLECVQYLIAVVIFGLIISFVMRFFKRK